MIYINDIYHANPDHYCGDQQWRLYLGYLKVKSAKCLCLLPVVLVLVLRIWFVYITDDIRQWLSTAVDVNFLPTNSAISVFAST